MHSPVWSASVNRSRRRFVQGVAAAGAALSLGVGSAAPAYRRRGPDTLQGRAFTLTYTPTSVNFTGTTRWATAINGSVPAPTLRLREGETVTLDVINRLAEDTSIHWHGLILPSSQDGVPHISEGFTGIRPGEQFRYQFPVVQHGTYWYHSHSGFQEQTGAYGAIVIEPAAGYPFAFDREYTLVLSDWSDESPETVYATLKKMPHYYNQRERTWSDTWQQLQTDGVDGFFADRAMWNQMRMSDRDISDVTGATYTFLLNGVPPAEGWLGLFQRGETVLLRIINAAAMTLFDLCIPGLQMTVVAADGQYIEPVSVDEIRFGVAETYDVLVTPSAEQAYTIFAQAIDRSGYARGTLTPDLALTAAVPPLDPAPVLGHRDMGMAMDHAGHGGHHHAGHGQHARHRQPVATAAHHGGQFARHALPMGSGPAGFGSQAQVVHVPAEYGPQVDMRADAAAYQLDDPGVGLRNNGRRVLTYADLFNLYPTPDPREPEREINLHLTGNMSRYMWSMNGISFADAEPLILQLGERVRINLLNDTMMNHPIHLHGMWSDLETGDPQRIPRKHTVIVQPGARISYLVTADAPGGWAYHCHLLYHMLGMFRHVIVR